MLTRVFLFLLDSVAGFLCGALLLRFFMQAFRVSFANPLGHFVVQLTNWMVVPLRRILPGIRGFLGGTRVFGINAIGMHGGPDSEELVHTGMIFGKNRRRRMPPWWF